MTSINLLVWLNILGTVKNAGTIEMSYNQPNISVCAQWNTSGKQIISRRLLGAQPNTLFVHKNNTIYAAGLTGGRILEWHDDNSSLSRSVANIAGSLNNIFVTIDGTIYVDNSINGTVEKLTVKAKESTVVMIVNSTCYGLFVDISNNIYCSLAYERQIVKQSLIMGTNTFDIVARDTGFCRTLCSPRGLFVDINLDLYVADCSLHEIRRFKPGDKIGRAIVQTEKQSSFKLNCPVAVFLDIHKDIFIVDSSHERIIRWNPNGFYCLLGCSQHETLSYPRAAAFDSYGNIFVLNFNVQQIKKFELIENIRHISSIVKTIYSSALDTNSSIYTPSKCEVANLYYESIYIKVFESGCHNLYIKSDAEILVNIYKHYFDPLNSQLNVLFRSDDNVNSTQIEFSFTFQVNTYYVIVITTYRPGMTGNFSITIESTNKTIFNRISVQSIYSSALTINSPKYAKLDQLQIPNYYYETMKINIVQNGYYNLVSNSSINLDGTVYQNNINLTDAFENRINGVNNNHCNKQFNINVYLKTNTTYMLLVTTSEENITGPFSIVMSGIDMITLEKIELSTLVHSMYSSKLTSDSPTYFPYCDHRSYFYETIQMKVVDHGLYSFLVTGYSPSNISAEIYKENFNPFNPRVNKILTFSQQSESKYQSSQILQPSETYIAVVRSNFRNMTLSFSIHLSGSDVVFFKKSIENQDRCLIGSKCQFFDKSIGLTLDDILRDEIRPDSTFNSQSFTIKMSAALTIVMFIAGLINSILSFITFQNKQLRIFGCGIYLLASSFTSFGTVTMFLVKYWFVVVTHMNSKNSIGVARAGCKLIEPLLKLFVYWDAWLNACIAIERAVNVWKGVNFNREKSKRFAKIIILLLPFCIISSIIHEPINRQLVEFKDKITVETAWCVTDYSRSLEKYNTAILFIHLVSPFVMNLFSALFIIFGAAHQRSIAQPGRSYRVHAQEQFEEHKQLIISPLVLVILASPRLIIALLSGCINISKDRWVYLSAYFISFIPSMLVFVIFVLPSSTYKKKFQETLKTWRTRFI